MADEEKNETTEETQAEEPQGSDAEAAGPAAEGEAAGEVEEAPAAEAADEGAPDPGADLPWKERRRLERSRQPHEAGPQQTVEERAAARLEARRGKADDRRRYRRNRRAKKGEAGTGTPPAEAQSNPAKVRQGVVVSDKADKTITVRIDIARRHPTYEKVVRRSRTLHAHDERNEAGAGDVVRVVESRPLSKQKRWRLLEVVEKAR